MPDINTFPAQNDESGSRLPFPSDNDSPSNAHPPAETNADSTDMRAAAALQATSGQTGSDTSPPASHDKRIAISPAAAVNVSPDLRDSRPKRASLADILGSAADRDKLRSDWAKVAAASDSKPVQAGGYVARIIAGVLFTSRTNNTPGYKLTFEICEGDHVGTRIWHDLWLTPAAMAFTKRDLGKLGVSDIQQLENALPPGIVCKIRVALRTNDDGSTFNQLRHFDVIRVEAPTVDPFAPLNGHQTDGGAA